MRLWSKRVAYMASLFVLLIVLFECRGGTPRSKRNTTISTVPKMLLVGLFRSPINIAIDSSRPPASLPPIGRHAERTPLSLSRVCMFVCGYVRVAHRDGALYLCTRSRAQKRTVSPMRVAGLACARD